MKRQVVRPWPIAPEDNTPFVPGIKVEGGKLLCISGMGAMPPVHSHPHVPSEWVLPEDAALQARRAFDKIGAIVEKAGGKFGDIIKITRYMKNIADQDKINEVVHEYFGKDLPCSTTVQVSGFVVPTMKIEIDAWALIPDPKPRTKPAKPAAKGAKSALKKPKSPAKGAARKKAR